MRFAIGLTSLVLIGFVAAQAEAQRPKAPPVVTHPPSATTKRSVKPTYGGNSRSKATVTPRIAKATSQPLANSSQRATTRTSGTKSTAPQTTTPMDKASATPKSGSPEHLIQTMQRLQETYRQQAMLLSQLIPHVQSEQRGGLQNAIRRAQGSRAKLVTQLEKMTGGGRNVKGTLAIKPARTAPAETRPAKRLAAAESKTDLQTTQRSAAPRAIAPRPETQNVQASSTDRIPPQPYATGPRQHLKHNREPSIVDHLFGHQATVISASIPSNSPNGVPSEE